MWIPIKAQCNTLLCKPWTYVLPAGPLKRIQGCSGTESKPADVPNWIYQLTLGHSEETDWRKCKRASVGASRWQITSTPIWHTGRPWGSSWTSAFTEEDDGNCCNAHWEQERYLRIWDFMVICLVDEIRVTQHCCCCLLWICLDVFVSLCRICINLSSCRECVSTFTGGQRPNYSSCESSCCEHKHTASICCLFDLVCERVLAVSFTCKPRPGEAGGAFCGGERARQAGNTRAPQLLTPK